MNIPIAESMITALDADPSNFDEGERKFVANIREYGWSGTSVSAEDGHLGFSYTTGFWKMLAFPELIIFSLRPEAAHEMLWNIFRAREAGRELSQSAPISGILESMNVVLLPVDKRYYREFLGWSRWFYGSDEFPCVQLVWPDQNKLFPWQSGCDASAIRDQQDLTKSGWGGLASRN